MPITAMQNARRSCGDIILAFYDGIKHKPETTFGNAKADVLERMDLNYKRINFCNVILESAWPD